MAQTAAEWIRNKISAKPDLTFPELQETWDRENQPGKLHPSAVSMVRTQLRAEGVPIPESRQKPTIAKPEKVKRPYVRKSQVTKKPSSPARTVSDTKFVQATYVPRKAMDEASLEEIEAKLDEMVAKAINEEWDKLVVALRRARRVASAILVSMEE